MQNNVTIRLKTCYFSYFFNKPAKMRFHSYLSSKNERRSCRNSESRNRCSKLPRKFELSLHISKLRGHAWHRLTVRKHDNHFTWTIQNHLTESKESSFSPCDANNRFQEQKLQTYSRFCRVKSLCYKLVSNVLPILVSSTYVTHVQRNGKRQGKHLWTTKTRLIFFMQNLK